MFVRNNNKEKLFKYIVMGLIVMLTVKYIPSYLLNNDEIVIIGLTASITFAILDMLSPTIKIIEEKNKN
jgi:hypothetical protein